MDANNNSNDQGIDTEALTATQGLIQRLSNQLDTLTKKQKELNDMLKGVFENDEKLQEADTVAQEANQTVKSRKKDLNDSQEVKDVKMKITDVREDVKMVKESLNTHLINYFQMTTSFLVDLPDGSEREMVIQARLKPKKN